MAQLAETTFLHCLTSLLHRHIEAVLMAGADLHMLGFTSADDFFCVGHIHSHGLFDDHVDTVVDAVQRYLRMGAAAGGDGDQLDFRMLPEHFPVVGKTYRISGVASFFKENVNFLGIDIAHCNQL